MRSLASRAVNLRQLGFKAGFGLLLGVGERLLANILLRAEQGADALIAPGGRIMAPSRFRIPPEQPAAVLNALAVAALLVVVGLRGQYGDM